MVWFEHPEFWHHGKRLEVISWCNIFKDDTLTRRYRMGFRTLMIAYHNNTWCHYFPTHYRLGSTKKGERQTLNTAHLWTTWTNYNKIQSLSDPPFDFSHSRRHCYIERLQVYFWEALGILQTNRSQGVEQNGWACSGFRFWFWKPLICLRHSGHCRPSLMGGSLSSHNQCRQHPCHCWCTGSCTCHESTLPSEPYRRHSHQSNPYQSCSSWCKGSLQHRSGHNGSMHRQRPSFHHASTHLGPSHSCRHHLQCWPPHLHPLPSKHHGSSPLSCHEADSVPGCNLHLLYMNHPLPVPPKWIPHLQQPIQGIQGQESSATLAPWKKGKCQALLTRARSLEKTWVFKKQQWNQINIAWWIRLLA